jgi:Peptidase family C25
VNNSLQRFIALAALTIAWWVPRFAVAVDVVVVCQPSLQPTLQTWIDDRKQSGIESVVVSPRSDPGSMRTAIRQACDEKTKYLLLVGRPPQIGDDTQPHNVPIFYEPTTISRQFGSTPTLATDRPYGDIDGDGVTDIAVGRWPVQDADSLTLAIRKTLRSDHSQDFGLWRSRVELVGGVGGFGPMIDIAIESVTRSVVTSALPPDVRTGVLYASPGHAFFPKTKSFRNAVIDRHNEGCRFWVYAGHGQVSELDHFKDQAILDGPSTTQLDRPDGSHSIAMLLACFTGAVDAPNRDFASQLWNSSGGPVAVVAGSRVTMPYGNSKAALAMIDAIYEQRAATLGEAWLSTQRQLESTTEPSSPTGKMIDSVATVISPNGGNLAAEKLEHASLYQLIGDPTLRLHGPSEVTLEIPRSLKIDEPLKVSWTSPIDGQATVMFDRTLGSTGLADPNDLTIDSHQIQCVCGETNFFETTAHKLPIGPIDVRIHIAGSDAWACGASRLIVLPSK